jgi:DNA-binding CsgD family transcriptional regulator
MREGSVFLRRHRDRSGVGIKLAQGKTLVGRARTCDLVLADDSVSRLHAELSVKGPTVTVRDLDSHNGTFVDDEQIESCTLQFGQRLRFGSVTFVLMSDGVKGHGSTADLETGSVNELTQDDVDSLLTNAQRRVFDRLLKGYAEKEIARRLKISRHTVHSHVREIYRLLNVRSRPELLARFVSPPDDQALST